MGAGFDFFLDGMIAVFGVYLVYSAIVMKRDGNIPPVMMSKDRKLGKDSDVAGFIQYMYVKTLAVGACSALCGAVGLLNDQFGGLGYVQAVMTVVFFVLVVGYGYLSMKAQKKYLGE